MPGEVDGRPVPGHQHHRLRLTTDPRAAAAQALLGRGCLTGVQALNEFTNVARRKLGMTWQEVDDALAAIRTACRAILPMDIETHADALRIAERHGYTIFRCPDNRGGAARRCTVLYSEDMQDGMSIGGRLRIVDPFRRP